MGIAGNGNASRVWKGESDGKQVPGYARTLTALSVNGAQRAKSKENLEVLDKMKRVLIYLMTAVMLLALAFVLPACDEGTVSPTPTSGGVPHLKAEGRFRVATTTSLYDTGLWGYLEEMFEDEYDVELDILYAGTGKAIEWGTRGDVDAITVHDKAAEEKFIADGYGVERVVIAYNYFLVVGPESDPAGIKDMDPVEAFQKLLTEGQANPDDIKFASRGDGSGTHSMEKSLWSAAGYEYDDVRAAGSWYVEGGGGMGPTLVLANEKQGYTLSDIGTYLAFKGDLTLVPIVDQGEVLLNVYSVLIVKSTKNRAMADNLEAFLTSSEIQTLIGEYGVEEYGMQLFTPCAGQDL